MILHKDETIWISFTTAGNLYEAAKAWVTEAVVIDPEHGIVREGDRVRVLSSIERAHQSEADAWNYCAKELGAFASAIRARAEDCARKAAALAIHREEAVA